MVTQPAPPTRPRRAAALLAAVLAVAAAGTGGCFAFKERHRSADPITRDAVGEIRDGVTTRREILARFGPPVAVARRGQPVLLPIPGPERWGRRVADPDAFFAPFPAEAPADGGGTVWYYDATEVRAAGALVVPIAGAGYFSKDYVTDRLWILIEERTGIVRGHVFRPAP